MSLNFCCHDDYTETGGINAIDTNVLIAYQMYLQANSNVPPSTVATFVDFYNVQVTAKAVASLGNKTIESLPVMDCANYTKTGGINAIDTNVLIAYQMYLQANSNVPPSTVATFVDFYNVQVTAKAVASLGNKTIEHLPSLEADTQVITEGGLVDKCGPSCTETCSVSVENDVLTVAFDATTLSNEHDGSVKGVEIVFENIVFIDGGIEIKPEAKETLVDNAFQTTEAASSLNFYYDYAIRTDGSDANKTKSVIGFIDVTQSGTGETKENLGAFTIEVPDANWDYKPDETAPAIADVRVFDSSANVLQYGIETCEG